MLNSTYFEAFHKNNVRSSIIALFCKRPASHLCGFFFTSTKLELNQHCHSLSSTAFFRQFEYFPAFHIVAVFYRTTRVKPVKIENFVFRMSRIARGPDSVPPSGWRSGRQSGRRCRAGLESRETTIAFDSSAPNRPRN